MGKTDIQTISAQCVKYLERFTGCAEFSVHLGFLKEMATELNFNDIYESAR